MKPDYFKTNVNLFIALAPVVRLDNVMNKGMRMLVKFTPKLEPAVQKLKLWNLFPLPKKNTKWLSTQFC